MIKTELIKVLMPFAKLGASFKGDEFDSLYECGEVKLTMKDLKRAQKILGVKNLKEEV